MIKSYSPEIERQMKKVYDSLSEKDKRIYAAIEVQKLLRGGLNYIAKLLGCDRKTINRGIKELTSPFKPLTGRIRKAGGGRKRILEVTEDIDEVFLEIIREHTAKDPMNEQIRWTNLNHTEIAGKFHDLGYNVGESVVKQLLKKHGFKKRKARKMTSIGSNEHRDEQFKNITKLRAQYEANGNPIISIDTKKKELLGNLYRNGTIYTTDIIPVFDHDFPHLADGIVIPYAIYDLKNNHAFVNIGTTCDTAAFVCDSLKQWWTQAGQYDYSNATSILVLADGGGSNSCRHYVFKEALQKLVNEIGIEIRMAHYPPYTSKWNPIEHLVFPHITKALQGVIFTSHKLVKELIENTKTKTGLVVEAYISDTVYQIGKKVAKGFKESMQIIFDDFLGQWNYKAIPLKS